MTKMNKRPKIYEENIMKNLNLRKKKEFLMMPFIQ